MIHGGLKARKELKGFDNVYKMIISKSAKISCLTYSSLYGFILKLTVDPDDSEYLNLNEKGDFESIQTEFIVKIAVISESKESNLPLFKDTSKKTNLRVDFLNEAKSQMEIYSKSIIGNKNPVCPGVADVHIGPVDIVYIIKKKCIDEDSKEICSIITKLLNKYEKLRVGIMTMAIFPDNMTLSEYLKHNYLKDPNDFTNKFRTSNMALKVICKLIILLLRCEYIHHDLHAGNVLVSSKTDDVVIIDFGRVSSLSETSKWLKDYSPSSLQRFYDSINIQDEEYRANLAKVNINKKYIKDVIKENIDVTKVKSKVQQMRSEFKKYIIENSNEKVSRPNKKKYIKNILKYIVLLDMIVYKLRYKKETYKTQMKWLFRLEKDIFDNSCVMAFEQMQKDFIINNMKHIEYRREYLAQLRNVKGAQLAKKDEYFKTNPVTKSLKVETSPKMKKITKKNKSLTNKEKKNVTKRNLSV
tara:strand:- start:3694 stop:5106 length:1413 start_codon:yes stop_codon:yes gene_type:complete